MPAQAGIQQPLSEAMGDVEPSILHRGYWIARLRGR